MDTYAGGGEYLYFCLYLYKTAVLSVKSVSVVDLLFTGSSLKNIRILLNRIFFFNLGYCQDYPHTFPIYVSYMFLVLIHIPGLFIHI